MRFSRRFWIFWGAPLPGSFMPCRFNEDRLLQRLRPQRHHQRVLWRRPGLGSATEGGGIHQAGWDVHCIALHADRQTSDGRYSEVRDSTHCRPGHACAFFCTLS